MSRAPYLISVGLDFGTAFTKCMVRNSATNELFPVSYLIKGEKKYLLPSLLYNGKDNIIHPLDPEAHGRMATIPYLKMALAEKARGDTPKWLNLVRKSNGNHLEYDLTQSIEGLVGYYLLVLVSRIREFVTEKWPDFGDVSDDQIFYNMSLPVAEIQQEIILEAFKKCLYWAVSNAENDNWPNDFEIMAKQIMSHPQRDDCHFLGEVTANVMSYRRERGGRPGLYLFVDVGAGTVDLSVFLYPDERFFDSLQTYTASQVSFTGSSQIELRALELADRTTQTKDLLARLRKCKESPAEYPELQSLITRAKKSLLPELQNSIRTTLGKAQTKHRANEFRTMNVIMGGGGWCKVPYRDATESASRGFHLNPEFRSLPSPAKSHDLWPGLPQAAQRFSVALGLSYPFWEWPEELFPDQISKIPRQRPKKRKISPAHEEDG